MNIEDQVAPLHIGQLNRQPEIILEKQEES